MPLVKEMLPQIEVGDGVFEVIIDPSLVMVTKLEIVVALGYADGNIDCHFDDRITSLLHDFRDKCTVRAGYRLLDIDQTVKHHHDTKRSDGFFVNGVFFNIQKIVASQLKGSEKIAAFAGTIGTGMEEYARRLFSEGDPLGGHFADTIASEAAEKTARILHDHIGAAMTQVKFKITNRYSPGYCGWPVSEQRKIFSFLPDNFCGIQLNDSSLMTPIKSVSGIIGIGQEVTNAPYLCGKCGRHDCTYRAYTVARNRRALVI